MNALRLEERINQLTGLKQNSFTTQQLEYLEFQAFILGEKKARLSLKRIRVYPAGNSGWSHNILLYDET